MELIDQFTGSKRRISPKMAQLRAKNGKLRRSTSATCAITAKKALASSFTRMVTNTRVCGRSISAMARVLTGKMREASCAVSTPVTGMRTKNTEEVPFSTKTRIGTMATG